MLRTDSFEYAAAHPALKAALGIWRVRVAIGSAVLLILFGAAMAISFGIKSPLDYSVFSASSAALLVAAYESRRKKWK